MKVKVKFLCDNAKLPKRGTKFSACYDLYATSCIYDDKNDCWVYGTGISTEFDSGWVAKIYPRSSNRKTDYYMPNSVGIVDSDYRNEWLVCLKSRDFTNLRKPPFEVGERIAQVKFERVYDTEFEIVDSLGESERVGGHGSTGRF